MDAVDHRSCSWHKFVLTQFHAELPLMAAAFTRQTQQPNPNMKAQDAKKEKKKQPQKTAKEKKLAKAEKKKNR
jgi:hypothetical protein